MFTQDLQQTLDQVVAYFTAHPEQLLDGAYTTIGVISRREGNTRDGAKIPVVAFRGFKTLGDFSRQHGPFQGLEPGPTKNSPPIQVVSQPPKAQPPKAQPPKAQPSHAGA